MERVGPERKLIIMKTPQIWMNIPRSGVEQDPKLKKNLRRAILGLTTKQTTKNAYGQAYGQEDQDLQILLIMKKAYGQENERIKDQDLWILDYTLTKR